ncbi:MAG: methyl-accepting chemotaxis protein, partial [Spirochaetota bacterium]
FMRSIYLVNRMIWYLSNYLRGVLQGLTSLKKSVPLIRFDTLGYMTAYLNLLFQYIYKMIMNLFHSVTDLSASSESSIADAARGTNEVYRITHTFASINLKADLQLQAIRSIREGFNDLHEIIKTIDSEVSIQKKQLKGAGDAVEKVQSAIGEMEQSSHNVAQLFERLNNFAAAASSSVENAYSVMAEISQTSASIRDIVSSIEKISGQISLLAMSASIESAHAGNHGFSTVAQSVRNLSDNSGSQSKVIRAQVEKMVSKVETGVELSRHVRHSFQSITESTRTSVNLFHRVHHFVDEQNQQSATVRSGIEKLLATTEEILSFTRQQVQVLDELTRITVVLEQEIRIIHESSQKQSDMSEEVISLFESLNNQVALNMERVHSIHEKINRFELN